MNSKGAFTLPAKVRKELGLAEAGQKLMLTYHPGSKTIEINPAPDFSALRDKFRHLADGKITDVAQIRQQRHDEKVEKYL